MLKFLDPTPEEQKLIDQLKASRQDFRFEQEKIKFKLLQSIRNQPEEIKSRNGLGHYVWFFARGLVFATLIIFVSTGATFAYASKLLPGDKLYPLNIWGDKTLLSLPLPAKTKVFISTQMTAKRLGEIQQIHANPSISSSVKAAAVKHSHEILTQIIEDTHNIVRNFEASKKPSQAQEINSMMNQGITEQLTPALEQDVQELENQIENTQLKNELESEFQEMKSRRSNVQELFPSQKNNQSEQLNQKTKNDNQEHGQKKSD
jgi:preprotein translocase subunit SecD